MILADPAGCQRRRTLEWVLGDQRAKSAPTVVTNTDPGTVRSSRATLQHGVRPTGSRFSTLTT